MCVVRKLCVQRKENIPSAGKKEKKRKKSLGQLCVQFIELFMKGRSEISLEQAGLMLSSSLSFEYHKMKTKIRRLYDIANVLQALNLIEKILVHNNKTGFRWLGYKGFLTFLQHQQRKDKRAESKKIFAISREPFAHMSRGVKHFKPRVLQASSPFAHKEVKTNFDLISAKTLQFITKENMNEFDADRMKGSGNLSLLLKTIEKA
eukprot:TRINITY_DN817_c0_g1_i6.p2 TRINITY_DN817_c0_g1~~TRINITY_DN817_c0_g1_i6.p2  ORF type:complete len:205 (+),score=22.08 TRINITY_DN817_c0_g1_i6:654-1268(+)